MEKKWDTVIPADSKRLCKWDIYVPLVTKRLSLFEEGLRYSNELVQPTSVCYNTVLFILN